MSNDDKEKEWTSQVRVQFRGSQISCPHVLEKLYSATSFSLACIEKEGQSEQRSKQRAMDMLEA